MNIVNMAMVDYLIADNLLYLMWRYVFPCKQFCSFACVFYFKNSLNHLFLGPDFESYARFEDDDVGYDTM